MDPLDHVVADVHGVGAGGEDVGAEGAFGPACGLKGLIPPACAFEESGADGFGGAAIDVVLDWGDGFAVGLAGGVFLDEAVADDELLIERLADGDVVVAVGGGEVAGAGIEAAWGEAGAGEFDEGLVLADGEGVGIGSDVADELAAGGAVGGEGEDGFDLGVFGEGFGGVEGDGGAGGVELVGALLSAGEGAGYVVGVAEEEVSGVDEDGAVGVFGLDFEAVEDGLGEGLADGELFGGVGGGGAEALVGLDEQDLGAGALEVDELAAGDLAAVEAEVVGAGAVGEGVGVEDVRALAVGVEVGDLEVELAGFGVPVERQVAVDVLHGGGFGGDGLGRQRSRDGEKSQGQMFGHASVLARSSADQIAEMLGFLGLTGKRRQGRVMVGSLRCSRRRRWVRVLRSSPVLGRAKAWVDSDQSSLKLVAWAEIQTWRMGVLGVMTNLEEPFSKMMFMTPLLSSNSKPESSSSAAMRDCLRDSRARSDSRRKVASSIMGLV